MSDSYILLIAQLSKPVDPSLDLLQLFSSTLPSKLENEENPIRSVLLLSPQSGIVWARGLSVSEILVSRTFDLGNSLSVDFEFPRSQPSYLVEIVPKKKNTALDIKKFQSVFDSLQSSFRGAVVMLLSECRIVVKFADPDEAVAQCASFVEPMKEDGVQTITSRTILIKEHVVMRAFYVGGSQTFAEFERAHKAAHNQSSTDFLNSKFSHFKDRPTVLSMQALPVSTEKLDFGGQTSEEVNIACATHYDYRLLRNSPPVSFPGTRGGSLVLRVNLEAKIRKSTTASGASEVTPGPSVSGPPALAPPPNLPHPSSVPAGAATAGAASSVSSAVSPATPATSNAPVPANAYIFWDYGSCPVDEEIASPEDVDSTTVNTMATNVRAVIDRYAQFRKDTGHPVKVNQCFRHVFAPQGNTFKNIEKIPTTWGAFTKNEFKVHHYSRKCSADSLLRGVIEGVLKSHARSGEGSMPLLLCFVTNDPEFASIAAYLKLENQNDIILVHNSAAHTVTSLVRKHYNWNMVQDITKNRKVTEPAKKNAKGKAVDAKEVKKQDARGDRTTKTVSSNDARNFSSALEELEEGEVHEEEGLLIIPPGKELVPWSAGDDASSGMFAFGIEDDPQLRNKKKTATSAKDKESKSQGKDGGEISKTLSSSASVDSGDNAQNAPTWRVARTCGTSGNDGELSPKFDLKYSSVATYLKRLLHWRRQMDDESGTQPRNYLLGEDTSGYPEDIGLVCYVRIEINSKVKKFSFQVRGPTAAAVEQRYLRIKSLAEECIKNRQSHSFNTWNGGQRTALIGSEVLALQEKACCAVAMFHYSGNTTVAEIVALRSVQHNAMLKFIQKLRPKEVTITVPYAFVCWYDNDMWEKMRTAFAVKAFVTDEAGEPIKVKTGYISPEESDTMLNVRLVGFGPKLIDRAVEHIKLNDEREEIVPVDTSDEITAAQTLAAMSLASPAGGRGKEKDKEKASPAAVGAGRTVVAAAPMSGPPAVQSHVGTREDMMRTSPTSEDPTSGLPSSAALTSSNGIHKAVYTFADREAGIYFYSFDTAFREYLDKAFGVYVDDTEHAAQLSLMDSGADYKTDTLKVTLCGTVLKQVQAARTYMDQFNTNVLGRHRIFFPRVSARKYKEIYNKKTTQVQKMLNIRLRETQLHNTNATNSETADPAGHIDPFKIPGFVNIRSKPGMLLNSKVTFPLDITVTICGPSVFPEGKAMLDQNRIAFNAIPSEFSVAAIVIPPTHHMKAALTLKTEREELVKRFNLVAMRWEEGLKSSGSVGTVKIWAYTKASLKIILQEIFRTDMGGAPAMHATEENENYVGPPVSMTSAFTMASVPHAASVTATSSGAAAPGMPPPAGLMTSPVPVPVSMPVPVPVINGTRASNGYAALSIVPPPGQPLQPRPGMNNLNNNNNNSANGSPYPPVPPSTQPGAMQAGNAKIFAVAKGAIRPLERVSPTPMPMPVHHHSQVPMPMPAPEPNLSKAIIRLPDLSLRFVMQGEPLKSKLNDVLERLLKNGAYIAYPFKDRTDPHACFELEGTPPVLARAAEELNDFIQRATRSLRAVQVIVNNEQFLQFTKGGDSIATGMNPAVTEFQAANGVHLVFNPPTVSSREAFSLVDMRLVSELVKKDSSGDAFSALDPSLDLQLSPKATVDKEMASVMVYNCFSQRSVEIAIISSNSSESGWTWGVNNLLLLVGSNTLGYSMPEVEQLNRGEVLVHTDRLTGKTILRIKPSAHTRGVNYQAAVLTNALLKCLQKANELGLKGLAISAPTDIDAFPDLNPEDIRALTVEAVVEFSKKCRSYLRFTKLVCIELGYNTVSMNNALELAATPQIPAAMAALERQLEPGQKDRMVRTLATLLERNENEHNDEVLQSTYQPHPHPQHGQPHGGLYGGPRSAPGHPRPNMPGGPYPGQGPMQGPGAPRADVRSKMSILTCNVPLPVSLLPALASHERPRGFKVFLVKGLLSSVVKSLEQIKLQLAAPKPIEHDLPINMADFY